MLVINFNCVARWNQLGVVLESGCFRASAENHYLSVFCLMFIEHWPQKSPFTKDFDLNTIFDVRNGSVVRRRKCGFQSWVSGVVAGRRLWWASTCAMSTRILNVHKPPMYIPSPTTLILTKFQTSRSHMRTLEEGPLRISSNFGIHIYIYIYLYACMYSIWFLCTSH